MGPASIEAAYVCESAAVRRALARRGVPERDLEDVAQEVFLTAHLRRDVLDPARPVGAWLVGIATRRALRYRALARHRVEVMGEPPAAAVPPVAEAALERDAASRLVHAALARIDGAQREVFVAHELGGTPVPEIARALGIPVDTAWSRLRRGRRAFGQAARRLA